LSLNIALEELAARIGVSDRTLRSFEKTGRCNLSTFVRAVEALGAISDLQPVLAAELRSISEMRQQVQSRQRQRTSRK
jgi:ribosome-binding protein aMBF1 (putative translation factor)